MDHIFDRQLESDRLLLRRLKMSDAADMFEYTSDESCTRFLSWPPHTEVGQTEAFLEATLPKYELKTEYSYAIEHKESGKFLGVVRLFDLSYSNQRAEVSYIMNPGFQGKGYMAEAVKTVVDFCLEEANFKRVQARCTVDNIGSERVMQKVGMTHEGKLKSFWNLKGAFHDVVIYGITK